MKKEYLNVNRNKLHLEFFNSGINTKYVGAIDDTEIGCSIIFADDTDMELVQQIIDVHDPAPLPISLTENQQRLLDLEMAMSAMLGGGF